jgi:hypothetical protein
MRSIPTLAFVMGLVACQLGANGAAAAAEYDPQKEAQAPPQADCRAAAAATSSGTGDHSPRPDLPDGCQLAPRAAPAGLLDCGEYWAGGRRGRGRSARGVARRRCPRTSGLSRLCELSAAGRHRRAVATGNGRCLPAARRQLAGHSVHAGIAAAGLHRAATAGRRRVSERLRLFGRLSRLGPGLGWRPVVLGVCPGDRRGAEIPFLPWVQPRLRARL